MMLAPTTLAKFDIPTPILIDKRSWPSIRDNLLNQIRCHSDVIGLDIETKDDRRHPGMNRAMNVNSEGFKASNKKLMFDTNRTDITGFSIYLNNSTEVYYVNLMHADVENRLPWEEARLLLDARGEDVHFVAHNAPYEITMFRKCFGYAITKNIICSMQLAVSLFNEDTYDPIEFMGSNLGGIAKLFPAIIKEFATYNPEITKVKTKEQDDLFYKVVAKESTAEHSYIGYIKTMTFGYGLKGLTKRYLGYTQMTFDQVLNGKAHMGQLTGEEVCSYGADDAWTCVKLYEALLDQMIRTNPAVVQTFFEQENPMVHIYSDVWGNGVRIDIKAVLENQAIERKRVADTLRIMKKATKALLPFPEANHDKLEKYDPKHFPKKNARTYRNNIEKWAISADDVDDFKQLYQVRSALSKEWAQSFGKAESTGMNVTYYQQVRSFLYDLCGCSFQMHEGKIQADGDAREIMMERWLKKHLESGTIVEVKEKDVVTYVKGDAAEVADFKRFSNVHIILKSYKQLAESEQVIKLFINSYLNITDPQTGRVYPTLNSLLNSRRMALAVPNLSQLPKFGGSAYVRSFFLPDEPWEQGADGMWRPAPPLATPPKPCAPGIEQVLLSADFSGIELVLIGDASGDEEFAKAYSQLPHGDLHTGTAADLLGMTIPDFKAQANAKQVRNEVGKPANFEYWYSGALSKTAKAQGWGSDKMWEATERYRQRYPTGEQWRQKVIQTAREFGYVTLPDHHTRIRFESTYVWANSMRAKFASVGHHALVKFGELVIKKIQSRSGNQAVNSEIQGTCATLTKRAVIAQDYKIKSKAYNCTFKFPVHDEVVYSCQVNQLWAFMKDLWDSMCNHPDIMKTLKLDASMAIGLNYQAYNAKTNPKGQIELSELSKLDFIPEERWGKQATEEEVMLICDYLFDRLKQPMKEEENVTA